MDSNLKAEILTLPNNGSDTAIHQPHGSIPHFAAFPSERISVLAPYSGLILTICLVILYTVKRYLLETFLFPKVYKDTYLRMDNNIKRGFLVHHLSASTKILLLCVGFKPFIDVVFGHSALDDGYTKGYDTPTTGDVLLVTCQLFVALYLFELMVRKAPSPIAVAHHVGAVLIGQSAIALSLRTDSDGSATMEFVLCVVWGAFDCLAELWLNFAFILYRIYPTRHQFLSKVFACSAIISTVGTLAETIVVMTLFGLSWGRWELSFKVVTPILHILFTIAQLHAAKILFVMWSKQKLLFATETKESHDLESKSETIKSDEMSTDETITELGSLPSSSKGDVKLESVQLKKDLGQI
jgi:hypothetical protein